MGPNETALPGPDQLDIASGADERRPTALSLTAADLADVSVVHTSHAGEELLVRGSKVADPPRIVAVRYWEERLFAHALATGVPITPQPAPA